MFFLSLGIAGKWTLITAVAPQSYCTSVASIQNFGGYIGGTVSPIVTGFVVDVTGSFVIALAIGAAITILGAVLLQTSGAFADHRRPIWRDTARRCRRSERRGGVGGFHQVHRRRHIGQIGDRLFAVRDAAQRVA